ncbi:zinc-binding dehydrogenase [Variovorax saccharolyticus]|uniref:zinc-binding dehydrogenase n=1 Tax=Variovorax saccharolyticus TaxID=3053516 RepID=UPI0025783560|nr:zinc-binding dehydrogenase [Variovorax sp. J22R187]MDM0022218.1 alcohol dehydrogenase catalytic domain-containing protein [Variovorax sp. J22R187]
MRMTAAVMYEQGLPTPFSTSQPFRIEEVELDPPGPGEVLAEVRAAGLCHSDLSVLEGLRKRPLPIVGGHEGAGIVREVGAGVTGLKPGDHVALAGVAGCGSCRACLAGRPGLCQAVSQSRAEGLLATGSRRLHLTGGGRLNHYSGISVFAQYAVVAPRSLVKIDPTVPFDVAALFGCAVVTGAGAVFNSAKVKPGATVAVIGLGGVGLTTVMAAAEAGASRIIGLDVLPGKFDLARAVGATDCFDPREPDAVQHILDLTDGGVDHAFEVSGNLAALDLAQAITARGGEVVGVGVGRTAATFTVAHLPWVAEERVLRGSFMGGGVPQQDIPRYVDLYLRGRLPVDKLRSEHIGFNRLNEGFDLLQSGAIVRQILLPHGG